MTRPPPCDPPATTNRCAATNHGAPLPRRIQVYDGDGELVATFPSFFTAHGWAVERAVEPATALPVQITSLNHDWTHQVHRSHCVQLHWPAPVVDLVIHRRGHRGSDARPRVVR